MNFCEGCNIACNAERCPKCGRKKLRAVTADDFCLAAQVSSIFGDNLKHNLQSEGIECVLMPYGTGVRAQFALPLESYLLYVRYRDLDHVRQLLKEDPTRSYFTER